MDPRTLLLTEDQAPTKRKRLPRRGRVRTDEKGNPVPRKVTHIPRPVPRPKPGQAPEGKPVTFGLFDPDD